MIEEKTLKKLEYFDMLERVSEFATSSKAKNEIRLLRPTSLLDKAESLLDETEEALNFVNFGIHPDFGIDSVDDIAAKAKINSTLSLRELLTVMRTLRTSRLLSSTLNSPIPVPAKLLPDMANGLYANKTVEDEIDFCVINEEELNDFAPKNQKNQCRNQRKAFIVFEVVRYFQISSGRHRHLEKRQIRYTRQAGI